MCGIAGCFGAATSQTIERMIAAERHRGPDDEGVWLSPDARAGLGHVRLSVIDLSCAGHQPMSYAAGRLCITYNGEIYNYRELRAELERHGHAFRSASDTEVVLAAYAQWGTGCLVRLRGMFAFALVDLAPPAGAPELLLARDRLGIKPLLYTQRAGALWFASELRSLTAVGAVDKVVDPEALLDFVAVGAVFQPRTIARGVSALSAGHYLEIRDGQTRVVRYWDLHEATSGLRHELALVDQAEAGERVRHALLDAARAHVIADVPVGAFLSGGVDSTAVVGLMRQVTGRSIRTFAVGFEGAFSSQDERVYARRAAMHLGCEHQEIVVTAADVSESYSQIIAAIDQPSVDGTNSWFVSRVARQSVTVALSGLGGDELFAGYPHFGILARVHGPRAHTRTRVWERLRRILGRYGSLVYRQHVGAASQAGRLALLRRLIGDHDMDVTINPEWRHDFRNRLAGRQARWLRQDADSVQQTSYAEIGGYLASTLLRDGDVMSMAHGLEVRPILLDHPLAELAYALPAHLKWRDGLGKRVLLDAVAGLVPPDLAQRPKMGFSMPFEGWMAGPLRAHLLDLLEGDDARAIFTPSYLRRLRVALRAGRPPHAMWAWGVLLAWLRRSGFRLA